MATDPRVEHWPKRDERHAAYLAIIPLTDSAVFIAHWWQLPYRSGGPETVLLAVHCPSDVIAGLV